MLARYMIDNAPSDTEQPPLDATDRKIISATQGGLPLVAQPYVQIAAQLELDVKDLLARMQRMQRQGIIRRIGLVPNHYKLGFRANGMSVWNVRDSHIDTLGELVGALSFVSHCYRRPRYLPDWPYNLFAMVHGRDRQEVDNKLRIIADLLGDDCQGQDVLFSTRILKKTGLRIAVP
jgi:DNA-binding Lrp family transcriptional regulator